MNEAKQQRTDNYVKQVNIVHDLEQKLIKTRMRSKESLNLSSKIRLVDLIQLLRDSKKHSEANNLEKQQREFKESKDKLHEIKINR